MGNIILLDENTINKIAAGEVVDRPASIVKELVENSIDAGASNIVVEIKNGGISYIRITDDGDGFRSDDVEIAFERHATSKIRQESDILKIKSMGFRGEALASVASISNIELNTKHKDENIGTKIAFSAGKLLYKEKSSASKGSSIIIKDVFFNTPARFKFLKKDYTEAGYIEEAIIRISLANPQIAIKLINNNKVILNTKGDSNIANTIYTIFGKETYDNILFLDFEYENMKVTGVIGKPNISRGTRSNEYTFINSRYVKDKILMSAIEKAYKENLAINKFPFAIVNLEMNTSQIDVNVHPAKLEVKFENETKVFDAVYFAIKDALQKDNEKRSPFAIIKEKIDIENEINSNDNTNTSINTVNNSNMSTNIKINEEICSKQDAKEVGNAPVLSNNVLNGYLIQLERVTKKEEDVLSESEEIKSVYVTKELEVYEESDQESILEDLNKEEQIKGYKYIGQLFNSYILIEIDDKMYVIDQHAAHERLIYERFKEHFYAKEKETQMLMIPMLIELKNSEVETIDRNMDYFEKCGYVLEKFSENIIRISGIPNVYDIHLDDKSIFLDMLDELSSNAKTLRQDKEFRFLATVACKAAIKANMFQNINEHKALLDEMLKLKSPFTCPHGRPTAYEISKVEIEKKVDRR